jgi:hypothetical protein
MIASLDHPRELFRRGGKGTSSVNAGGVQVRGARRRDLDVQAIADIVVTATTATPVVPEREHGRDVAVWEIPTFA